MHKDGLHSIHGRAAIVNLRRGENKRFRNGNSRFIFPQRVLVVSRVDRQIERRLHAINSP